MNIVAALLLAAQSERPPLVVTIPPPSVPQSAPWYDEAYVLRCKVIDEKQADHSFTLSLTSRQGAVKAAVVGGAGLDIRTERMVDAKEWPKTVRGQAEVRRIEFLSARQDTVVVQQLFEGRVLSSTMVVVGGKAKDNRSIASERAVGFCVNALGAAEGKS